MLHKTRISATCFLKLVGLLLIGIQLVACQFVIDPSLLEDAKSVAEEGDGLVTAAVPAPITAEPLLPETHVFPDFGFSIDYPEGWFVGDTRPNSIICELEEDKNRLLIDNLPVSGYCISHDHRTMSFMRGIGLPADPTLEDLLKLNSSFFSYQDPQVSETTIFGAPALQVVTISVTGPGIDLMGFVNEEAFLLTLSAPTEEARQAFIPIWEEILASIDPSLLEDAASVEAEGDGLVAEVVPTPITAETLLPETHVFPDFGFSIDYPEGWSVFMGRLFYTNTPFSSICEVEADHFRKTNASYCIGNYQLQISSMHAFGLPADPTLEDLVKTNSDIFGFQAGETSETSVFGVPALQVKTVDAESNHQFALMGFVADGAFLLAFSAPSEEALEAFAPIWEEILASIEAVTEE